VLVLDAEAGILEQDKKIADLIVGARKSCIIAINKWDLAQAEVKELRKKRPRERPPARPENRQSRQLTTLAEFGRWVQEKLFFLDYAPVIFTSAVSGLNLDRLMEAVRYVRAQLAQRIPTALLNRALRAAVERRQPVSSAGYHLKFFYATQTNQQPPTFVLFVNRPELLSVQYAKYLTNHLRQAFGYEGCPMVLVPRARPRPPERQRRQPKAR
jgi:GTP-binding protein